MRSRSVLVRGGVWSTTSTAATIGAGLLTAALVTRLLSPNDVGTYFAVVATVMLSALIGSLGLLTPLTAFLSESDQPQSRSIILRGFLITAGGATAVGLLFLIGADALTQFMAGDTDKVAWWMLAILSTTYIFRQLSVESLIALARFRQASIVRALPASSTAALLAIASINGSIVSLQDVLGILLVANLIAMAVGLTFLRDYLLGPRVADITPRISKYLSIGLPWLGTSILVFAFLQAGVLIVSVTSSTLEAAEYGTAFRAASLVALPAAIVRSLLPPFIARCRVRDTSAKLERLMRASASISGAAAALATIVLIFGGKALLTIAFGSFYTTAWASTVLLAIAFTVDALTGQAGQMLALIGKERSVLYVFLVTTPVALVAMVVLGRIYGSTGVAVASALSIAASNVALARIAWSKAGIRTWATVSRPDIKAMARDVLEGLSHNDR